MLVDSIIVGQGVAGTVLAFEHHRQGRTFHIVDAGFERGSSFAAAGLMNPVTGRRIVKTWMFDALWPAALDTYHAFEREFDVRVLQKLTLTRCFRTAGEENDFLAKAGDEHFKNLITAGDWPDRWHDLFKKPFACGLTNEVYQLELPVLLQVWRQHLRALGAISEEVFDFSQLDIGDGGVRYKGVEAARLYFCEGYRVHENPFFSFLPMRPNRGEALLIPSDNRLGDAVVKQGEVALVPLQNGSIWVGTFNQQNTTDATPTEVGYHHIAEGLRDVMMHPPDITGHVAGIRPAIKDRRPVAGAHPQHPNLFVLNGLGTKGVSLAPFLAKKLLDGSWADMPEVLPSRFY